MPPAISDDESGSGSGSEAEIAYKRAPKAASKDEENEEEEEDEDEEEDEYVVEKVMSHLFEDDGTVKYEIKWQGYERKQDRTWEPEENLEGAKEALDEYFRKIGGRPTRGGNKKRKASQTPADTPVGKGRGRGRKPKQEQSVSAEPEPKPVKKEKEPPFPKGSWEDHITSIDTIEEVPNPKTGMRERYALVVWADSRKTRHPLSVLNQKCPQKMLAYYEQHLYFNYN